MRRKNAVPGVNASSTEGGQISPTSTGAMDSLLEKLRAAAPQARDQRDRRRRARLQTKHRERVASGQGGPDPGDASGDGDGGLLTPDHRPSDGGSPQGEPTSESEDVAERAANMLQGLRGDGSEAPSSAERDSIRVRRRRESADGERRARRQRRGAPTNSVAGNGATGETSPTEKRDEDAIPEEDAEVEDASTAPAPAVENGEDEAENKVQITTIISPPSPDGSKAAE
jgi:cytokinesis protein